MYSPDGRRPRFPASPEQAGQVISVEAPRSKLYMNLEREKVTFDSPNAKKCNTEITYLYTWRKEHGKAGQVKLRNTVCRALQRRIGRPGILTYGDSGGTMKCSGLDENGHERRRYFHRYNTVAVDSASAPITAMIRRYDRLLIFKENQTHLLLTVLHPYPGGRRCVDGVLPRH